MNSLSSLSRVCARRTLTFRPLPSSSIQSMKSCNSTPSTQQLPRYLSTTTTTTASQSPSDETLSSKSPTTLPLSSSSSTPSAAATSSTNRRPLSPDSPFLLLGTVTRTGTMAATIQITTPQQVLDRHLQKTYSRPRRLLAHDPFDAGFLREGDVVEYGLWSPLERAAKETRRKGLEDKLLSEGKIRLRTRKGKERKLSEVGVKPRGPRWVVRKVVTPFGVGLEHR